MSDPSIDSSAPEPPGDSRAREREFMRLFSAHERRVKGYVLALVPNWNDAQEVISETNVRLWEQFDYRNPPRDFGAWASTIAHYMVLAHRKSASRSRLRMSDAFLDAIEAPAAEAAAEGADRDRALHHCIEQLNVRNRDLVRRCYAGEETIREVAEQLGRSEGAVYTSLTRIRQFLHRCVEKTLAEEDGP